MFLLCTGAQDVSDVIMMKPLVFQKSPEAAPSPRCALCSTLVSQSSASELRLSFHKRPALNRDEGGGDGVRGPGIESGQYKLGSV